MLLVVGVLIINQVMNEQKLAELLQFLCGQLKLLILGDSRQLSCIRWLFRPVLFSGPIRSLNQ
jgi:hypothetical protein